MKFISHKTLQLYHFRKVAWLLLTLLLVGCVSPQINQKNIQVTLMADGKQAVLSVPAGTTAVQAVQAASISMGPLDRIEPSEYTVLSDGGKVRVIRVEESFEIQQEVIPFEQQVLRSETLTAGETRLAQPGQNGTREITVRILKEDGVEISRSPVKSVVVQEPVSEVVMMGSQVPFAPLEIPGKLAYLSGGNAWLMEGSTTNRRVIVDSGDLDGRVFRLSPDGHWLLFTRRAKEEGQINTLWVASADAGDPWEMDLQVANIVHFADWAPNSTFSIAFSTVEPRSAAPGWQANNDLQMLSFSTTGWISSWRLALDANAGGIYGWWGSAFVWRPDGLAVAYMRPDGVGTLILGKDKPLSLLKNPPLQTYGDWAWTPGLDWSPLGDFIFTVQHVGGEEESPQFDLVALSADGGSPVPLVAQTGMFAYPAVSPLQPLSWEKNAYQVAYLQAVFPDQSDTSLYRMFLIDRDGSNRRLLFPSEDKPGMEPQQVRWSPDVLTENQHYAIAVIYLGNLWLVDTESGQSYQVTGDNSVQRMDWR